jgi:hypothetical protein
MCERPIPAPAPPERPGPRGKARPVEADALAELEFHWGSAYHLTVVEGLCTARGRDGKGGMLTDPTPEGLCTADSGRLHRDARASGPAVSRDGTCRNVGCPLAETAHASTLPPVSARTPANRELAPARCPTGLGCWGLYPGGRP